VIRGFVVGFGDDRDMELEDIEWGEWCGAVTGLEIDNFI